MLNDKHPYAIEPPPGVSVENNIAAAKQFAASHSPRDTLLWFADKVQGRGPWDYKQQGRQYESFGNWNYGATGTALGIPPEVLKRMGGLVQILHGTSRQEWGTPATRFPYGDDPDDQAAIVAGIEWARANGHQGLSIFLHGPIHIPMSDAGWGLIHPQGINPAVHDAFVEARAVILRRDPLAIDLDHDGIETIGITTTPVFFDHDGDGMRTPTGWLQGDDSGAELFGTDTLKSDDQLALSGFDALRDLDSDGNGLLNANDTAFAQLQLWQDRNQDGLSQADELASLAHHGITAIDGFGLPTDVDLGNGNRVTATALVMRRDGSPTQAFDLILANEPPLPTLEPLMAQAPEMPAPLDPPPPASEYAGEWGTPLTPVEIDYAMNDLWQMAFNAGRSATPSMPTMSETDAYFAGQVDSLINAMAAFLPSTAAQTTLRPDERLTGPVPTFATPLT
jgi:hypothetical protein